MKDFAGRIAVVAGGGTGIGRELARQLASAGCHVAIGDIIQENLDEALPICLAAAPPGTRVTGHLVDVSVEADMRRFSDEVRTQQRTEHVNLLFNNAGIGGGGSFVKGDRKEWARTFGVCWGGVFNGCAAFLDMVLAADEAHIINTSSINGFYASLGRSAAHTAYSAAKFAVRGFSEALITDLRLHAPHVKVSVVFPGHVASAMVVNTSKVMGRTWGLDMTDAEVALARRRLQELGMATDELTELQIREAMAARRIQTHSLAPTTSAQAAEVMLKGVRENRWRILVGDDAHLLDEAVRRYPEEAYEPDFSLRVQALQEGMSDA